MASIIKVLFFIVAALFVASQLASVDLDLGGGGGSDSGEPASRDEYVASYDDNDDGVINDEEYRRGELERIEEEIEHLRSELAREIADALPSPYTDNISLMVTGVDSSDPDEEYLVIGAWDDGEVVITGWTVKSLATGRSISIPKGFAPRAEQSFRFGSGLKNIEPEDGERAFIVSGSPSSRERFEDDTSEFTEGDWVALLHSSRQIWLAERDIIMLFDDAGRVVDYVEY